MTDDRKLGLTPGQRDCLLLVGRLQSSKQIARTLGISRHTVDQRIARACRQLGVATRTEAALKVADPSLKNGFEISSVTDPVGLEINSLFRSASPSLSSEKAAPPGTNLGDSNFFKEADNRHTNNRSTPIRWPFPTRRRAENDLTLAERLLWAAVICAASIFVFGGLLASLAALRSLN